MTDYDLSINHLLFQFHNYTIVIKRQEIKSKSQGKVNYRIKCLELGSKAYIFAGKYIRCYMINITVRMIFRFTLSIIKLLLLTISIKL